jgi:RNA recognition motif-containing protein
MSSIKIKFSLRVSEEVYKEAQVGKKLYVGNLPFSIDDQQLHQAFSSYGQVMSAKVIMDRDSGRSKGFGFVEMSTDEEAQNAMGSMNGTQLGGRDINVSEARDSGPRTGGPRGGGGGFRGRNGGGPRGPGGPRPQGNRPPRRYEDE